MNGWCCREQHVRKCLLSLLSIFISGLFRSNMACFARVIYPIMRVLIINLWEAVRVSIEHL